MTKERAKEIRVKTLMLMFCYPGGLTLEDVISCLMKSSNANADDEREFIINILSDLVSSGVGLYVRDGYLYQSPVLQFVRRE